VAPSKTSILLVHANGIFVGVRNKSI
jgi:hypothetical protein